MVKRFEFVADELQVHVAEQMGNMFSLNSHFSEGITVLKLMRRFGCSLLRQDAQAFSDRGNELHRLGVSTIGVGFDVKGTQDFVKGGFWGFPLFLDPTRDIYRYFDVKRMSMLSGLGFLWSNKNLAAAKKRFRGDQRGDTLQLGATFVIDYNGNIVYSFIQTDPTCFPDMDEIVAVCREERRKLEFDMLCPPSPSILSLNFSVLSNLEQSSSVETCHESNRLSLRNPDPFLTLKDDPLIETFSTYSSSIRTLVLNDICFKPISFSIT
ncbi:hypothetical protein DSO57_1000273 [Entomophthora muscae]|uniref:Uncharacterized protein n=1 Tax=Entomophthora muscae TaxID=34485 RepID=A0ACC2SYI4_9FUNG|nr:hypothetical protein DSO57_1000273 [Entomophthora muscae]